jgi:hypothetical protein
VDDIGKIVATSPITACQTVIGKIDGQHEHSGSRYFFAFSTTLVLGVVVRPPNANRNPCRLRRSVGGKDGSTLSGQTGRPCAAVAAG